MVRTLRLEAGTSLPNRESCAALGDATKLILLPASLSGVEKWTTMVGHIS